MTAWLAAVWMLAQAANAPSAAALDPATLGWPSDTRVVRFTRAAHVMAAPQRGTPLGKVAAETALPIRRLWAGNAACPAWAEIEIPDDDAAGPSVPATRAPQIGFVCVRHAAPAEAVAALALPVVPEGSLLPGDYFRVDDAGAYVYRGLDDAAAGMPTGDLPAPAMVRSKGVVLVDNLEYHATDKGLVAATQLRPLEPSGFTGVRLRPASPPAARAATVATPPVMPVWVTATSIALRQTYAEPAARRKMHVLPRYHQVTVLETQGRWARVASSDTPQGEHVWIQASSLTQVPTLPPPPTNEARYIDVFLRAQVLVAFEAGQPVFVTLVSTGRGRSTPRGTFRIRAKAAVTPMASEAEATQAYDVSAVPWAQRLHEGIFLHAAYWHDGFGRPRSHGCINLSPRDARVLFDWTSPRLPDGWSEIEAPAGGTLIRIHP